MTRTEKIKILRKARKKIGELQKQRDRVYQQAVKRTGVYDNNLVWDFMFNGSTTASDAIRGYRIPIQVNL